MNFNILTKRQEVKVGDYITVVLRSCSNDKTFCGDLLRVKVVDYPYVRVHVYDGYSAGENSTLNLNDVEIMPLSQDFVDDVLGC